MREGTALFTTQVYFIIKFSAQFSAKFSVSCTTAGYRCCSIRILLVRCIVYGLGCMMVFEQRSGGKKKRVSKKNKKSWRKHTDTKDVDSFLDEKRLEERLGYVT